MIVNGVPSAAFRTAARQAIEQLTDWTDGPPKVSLVETVFDPSDGSTYPSVSTAFAAINGTTDEPWELLFDAVSQKWLLVAPEPEGGWDFVSSAGGVTITGFKVELASDTAKKITGNNFETPIPVAVTGEHIELPYVTMDVTSIVENAITPYVMG